VTENLPVLGVSSIDELFEGRTRDRLERDVLTRYLPRQRWFSSKARVLTGTRILDHGRLGRTALPVLTVVIVDYEGGGQERYSVPLALATGETADALSSAPSGPAMAWLDVEGRTLLIDGLAGVNHVDIPREACRPVHGRSHTTHENERHAACTQRADQAREIGHDNGSFRSPAERNSSAKS